MTVKEPHYCGTRWAARARSELRSKESSLSKHCELQVRSRNALFSIVGAVVLSIASLFIASAAQAHIIYDNGVWSFR